MNLETYIIISAAAIILLVLVWVISLEIKLKKLLGSKNGSLDDAIDAIRKDTENLKKHAEKTTEKLEVVDKKLKKTVSGNETVRFNPFRGDGSGSNQSFATALVNSEGDGVVISSIYSRDHLSVFSKPIKNLSSEYELTAEEKTVLQKAKESII
jgi:archaellum component FlaC